MSLHKLTAGSGYDYLTRQVARQDGTDPGHVPLADYYTAKGEAPGRWVGAGLAGVDGLSVGDEVTAEQMQALFGSGHHPLAHQRRAALPADASDVQVRAATRLGAPFKVYAPAEDVSPFRREVARRLEELNASRGLPRDAPVSIEERARVRTEVAVDLFRTEHGRDPQGPREIAATIARLSRPRTTAVAGYDLTFSPVKSVSVLWALAPRAVAEQVEAAHHDAVADAMRYLEGHALFTRTGAAGVRQVEVRGMVAAAFTHRDSRAGDPDLHTHLAVANKVQTLDGRWLAIDGRVLYQAAVSASEVYNTALEQHLSDRLGVRFAERPDSADRRRRPVREVVGVDPGLSARWSRRRQAIDTRRAELAARFLADHGRPPTEVEAVTLADQATLETRQAKHAPRSLAEQRATWRAEALQVLGGEPALLRMLRAALPHRPAAAGRGRGVDPAWVGRTATAVLEQVQERRAHWQVWHVRAEAYRQVRGAGVPTAQVPAVVEAVVDHVLGVASVPLRAPADGIVEPAVLRRRDGASVYTVAGADRYTSAAVLAAEARLVAHAARTDGWRTQPGHVDLALLGETANGLTLNDGQAALVRAMATSGRRVQLGIAAAGTGKTTAMRALAAAWREAGGTVLGLAPSAAAAAVLATEARIPADTLAKLDWDLTHARGLSDTAAAIEPDTLVIIDEAGMADTLTLDRVVGHVLARGSSVRLVGDDQQLAAIGAGGVLRDIDATHGSVRLDELVRFADPAEAAATLALRDGRPEALGFYLDHHRVHVGDLRTLTDEVFDAWAADRGRGLDSIMLAPTRELVAQLNAQARAHRLAGADGGPSVPLADGNDASAGDLVLTRSNDRRLRTSGTDWVKNGDRWIVLAVTDTGALAVWHATSGLRALLPADYVRESVELGYAATVHAAQGVSADTMHGLASGEESRQQLYTMLTRGRQANHVYLEVVGDGDRHNVIRPDATHPRTPTEVLEQILGRDDAPRSATTVRRDLADPALLLGQATARYLDALYVGAEQHAGPNTTAGLDTTAEQLLPGLTGQPAWPTLRAHLLLIAADGHDPATHLHTAAALAPLDDADDPAAVLDWRLDDTGLRNSHPGPLPWIPAVPETLARDPQWGDYLTARDTLVRDLAARVRDAALTGPDPVWAPNGRPDDQLLGDVAVWRAATGVDPADHRPTGPRQLGTAAGRHQAALRARLAGGHSPALAEWGDRIRELAPAAATETFTAELADRLAGLSRAGVDAAALLARVAADQPLPDDHAAAALWWRLQRHLPAALAAAATADPPTPDWASLLRTHLPSAAVVPDSSAWPALTRAFDQAVAAGWQPAALLADPPTGPDPAEALLWRTLGLLDRPDPHPDTTEADQPHDLDETRPIVLDDHTLAQLPGTQPVNVVDLSDPPFDVAAADVPAELDLALAAQLREVMDPAPLSEAAITRMLERATAWDHSPVSEQRLLTVTDLTARYYAAQLAGSWAQQHLADRFGPDTNLAAYRPGYAPAGWTSLVTHLRAHGVTDEEMLTAGVATRASTGRLIDRFRDRLVLPITTEGRILGFIGRRHPDSTQGPKYLNTADTPLFAKGAQLYGLDQHHRDATPVLVEGPLDAIAVTTATNGRYTGLAPLGTALTEEQARQLAALHPRPLVATDNDPAGTLAAERAYWQLTALNLDPHAPQLPPGADPADLTATRRAHELLAMLEQATPLGDRLLTERLRNLPVQQALPEAVCVLAARPAHAWPLGTATITAATAGEPDAVARELAAAGTAFATDPAAASTAQIVRVGDVRARLRSDPQAAATRWASLARQVDPRLLGDPSWAATAAMLDQINDASDDVGQLITSVVQDRRLNARPAEDLRYRLLPHLPAAPTPDLAKNGQRVSRRPPRPAASVEGQRLGHRR